MPTEASKTLGYVLKQAREFKQVSLRTVEEKTGVSNAYLSQLENDKIKKPSADILHKLAIEYSIDFNYLLHVAGLVERGSKENVSFGSFVFSKDNLTEDEEEELINYLKFIRKRNKK